MRILITGATGLIGKELAKRLVANGHEIVVVSRDPERARRESTFPAQYFRWAGSGAEFPSQALKDVDAIVNLAGESIGSGRWTEEKKRRIRDSRVLGTRSLVEAVRCLEYKPRIFVQGSAAGIYGDRDDEILTETSEPGRGFLADLSKEWEAEAEPVTELGLRLAIVRTALVLSVRGGALKKLIPLFSKGLGGQLGGGRQWMSWVHIEDIVRVFAYCVEYESASGVFNGSAPEPVRNDRFSLLLARSLGHAPFLPVPKSVLGLALGEASSAILESERVLPARLDEIGFKFRFPEFQSAIENLCGSWKDGQKEFISEQWLPRKPEEIFPYFASESNLEALMPPAFNFHVISKSTPTLQEGTLIDFRMNAHGFPVHCQSIIREWVPGRVFIDEQVKGPYTKWIHTHEFEPMGNGTLIRDRVVYRLPLGWLGNAMGSWMVESDIEKIFNFRRRRIDEIFGEEKSGS